MGQSILEHIESGRSALREGQALGRRAAGVGFDWPTALEALQKVKEELDELEEEVRLSDNSRQSARRERLEDELGDVLFAIANVARKLDIDAEEAMASTNRKFRRRFSHIEASAEAEGRKLEEMTLDEMEAIWQDSKENVTLEGD